MPAHSSQEYMEAYREANAVHLKAYSKAYYAANKKRVLARIAKHRTENLEEVRAKAREYNRGRYYAFREHQARRRALLRAATVERVSYKEILLRDGYVCHICGDTVEVNDVHFDHVVPIARGGRHCADNIKVAHATCNLRKRTKLLEEMN